MYMRLCYVVFILFSFSVDRIRIGRIWNSIKRIETAPNNIQNDKPKFNLCSTRSTSPRCVFWVAVDMSISINAKRFGEAHREQKKCCVEFNKYIWHIAKCCWHDAPKCSNNKIKRSSDTRFRILFKMDFQVVALKSQGVSFRSYIMTVSFFCSTTRCFVPVFDIEVIGIK